MRLSNTGVAFAGVFLAFSVWCLICFAKGDWQWLLIIGYITFPFSLASNYLCTHLQSVLSLIYTATNWMEVAMDIAFGILEFYCFGWLLERPFRR
jgi:hypothetical protein